MEGESQSANKVRKKHYPFLGFRGRDDLPFGRKPMHDDRGQVSGLLKLLDALLRNGGGHPLASRSEHVWNDCMEEVRAGALELKRARMDERRNKKAWVKKENPYLFIKVVETVRLPTCPLKSLISQAPQLRARLGYPYPY